ncbi:Deoxyuridine 5'-triphosphate nucleotidohydrolase [uncultured Sporomusa sp.]|uniref:dUTP diphosphatase n=1 Tax=uncultured Sporomusa sp. TaxID=307249 RepID=A0A212LS60_9FIRM|nr:dUTP diphosphatase [uncultured Sporomusa sp.]SCM80403.1 Deoxyuridine 5'-triphosphate nucleotidohydrolase [uncultured Sporomusa sp.]
MTRGFELITQYKDCNVILPVRKTGLSAGYDIAAAQETVLSPGKVALIPTGLKAYMQEDEYLGIHIRSGLSIKHSLSLINGQGIIDADYYNNPDNEGHILVGIFNHGTEPLTIAAGTRIAQGIFYKYLKTDNDCAAAVRSGGLGSTGE